MPNATLKWKLLSDLHCEGRKFSYAHSGEDVVILAGDIHTRNRHEELITQIPSTVKILLCAGNHEYYGGVFEDVNKFMKGLEKKYKNFTFLNNSSITIGDVHVYGGTMFTDMLLYGHDQYPYVKHDVGRGISDFYYIAKKVSPRSASARLWTVDDHMDQHKRFVSGLQAWLLTTEGKKRLVVSHFMPHKAAIDPRFRDSILNPYFTSDMTHYMGWPGNWCYGHGHSSGDFMEGETRVVGNPHGYGNENPKFDPNFMFEL